MRAVIQRVDWASLSVAGKEVSQIERGAVVLISVGKDDTPSDAQWIAGKILNLKIFSRDGKISQNALEVGAEILVVSQFTLHAEVRKGKKPSFDKSAPPTLARSLITEVVRSLREGHKEKVAEGCFGEEMQIAVHLAGPVTIWLDSKILSSGVNGNG